MKTHTPALLLALTISVLLPAAASAQESGDHRYRELSRFPVIRKAFRRLRGDVRYHASALHHTARDIRHDVGASIRGEASPREQKQNRYGYPGEGQQPAGHRPAPSYLNYYEEPPLERGQNSQIEQSRTSRQQPTPPGAHAIPDIDLEPIIAPEQAPEQTSEHVPPGQPAAQSRPEKKPKSRPQAKPEPGQTKNSEPEPKSESAAGRASKPIVGKIEYPEAKRSNREGFHYSPYEPYELLDTQGIEPGGLAKDPGNGNIFRLPK